MRSGSQGSPLYIGIKKYKWIISWGIASSMACRKPDRQYQLMPYFVPECSVSLVLFNLRFIARQQRGTSCNLKHV